VKVQTSAVCEERIGVRVLSDAAGRETALDVTQRVAEAQVAVDVTRAVRVGDVNPKGAVEGDDVGDDPVPDHRGRASHHDPGLAGQETVGDDRVVGDEGVAVVRIDL